MKVFKADDCQHSFCLLPTPGLKAVIDSKPDCNFHLIVYGTPAEEGGGGKCLMIEKGVFDEADICMMSHPAPYDLPKPSCLGVAQYRIIFKGKILIGEFKCTFLFKIKTFGYLSDKCLIRCGT